MKKVFIINFLLLFLLYFLFKYLSLFFLLSSEFSGKDLFITVNKIMMEKNYEDVYKNVKYRPIENENSDNAPIVILGCSYAMGVSMKPLNDNETISYMLSKILQVKRPIYNMAIGSQGLQAMIWQFTSKNIYKYVKKEPVLIIYVLIDDSTRRLYMECCPWNKSAFYKDINGQIKLIKNPIYYSYISAIIRDVLFKNKIYYDISDEVKFNFLRKHFLYLKSESDKKWKNSKWLIFYYNDQNVNPYIKNLEKDGFKVIILNNIVSNDFYKNQKYRISDNDKHPTKEAWEIIVPKLYEEIKKQYNIL